jgi:hypothetical protein
MSTGQGIGGALGAIAGGVIGFFGGNPMMGVTLGFTLGSAIGGLIDPPDTNAPGGPDNSKIDVTTTEEGSPIPDLLGMSKLSGNILGFWNPRTEEQKAGKKGGGKGGSKGETTQGYKFFLTWAVCLCEGPVDEIYSIYVDSDTCVWKGNIVRPISGSYETIVIDGIGTCRFYFGTATQPNESVMDGFLEDPTANPAYRNWCYAFFDDCCVGPDQRMPSLSFVVRKTPVIYGSDTLETYDINPASAIYYIMTQKLGISTALFDTVSFAAAKATLETERFGLGILFSQYQPALTYLEAILNHIDAVLTFQADGLFHLDLMRSSTAVASIPPISEDYMLEPMMFKKGSWLKTINEMKIQYPLRYFTCDVDCEPLAFVLSISSISTCGIYQFSCTGGVPPYTWSVSGGTNSIDQNGVLTSDGSGSCTVTCTDSVGNSVTA